MADPLHDLEYAVDVDPEVLMGDQVSKARDVGPGDLGRRLARLGSQGERLAEDLIADAGLEHVGRGDVYGQIEDFPGFAAKRGKIEEGAAGLEVDEEIHVACICGFAARQRPEGAQMTNAVPLGGIEQPAAPTAQFVRLRAELAAHRADRTGTRCGGRLDLQAPTAGGQESLQGWKGGKRRASLIPSQG